MAQHQVVCTEQEPVYLPTSHAHIVAVGTGAVASKATQRWTLAETIHAIRSGEVFYTVSPSTNKIALVRVVSCDKCNHTIIRSAADAVTDNNLDNLRTCNFR
jgi:Protein of unknown function (DUF3892)